MVDTTQQSAAEHRVVTAVLGALCADEGDCDALVSLYKDLRPPEEGRTVFHTRLGLTLIDMCGEPSRLRCQLSGRRAHRLRRR